MKYISFIILAIYFVCYAFAYNFGYLWLMTIPGIILIYYLPGNNLNAILFNRRDKMQWFLRFPLDILSSITILSFCYLIFREFIKFAEFKMVAFVFLTNFVIALISFFVNKNNHTEIHNFKRLFHDNREYLLILGIMILLFILRIFLNPYIYDIDSLLYFDAYNNILSTTTDNSRLFLGREAFPFLVMATHYVIGFNYIQIFKYFIPLILYFVSIILFIFVPKNENRNIAKFSVLLLLSSPMLIIMNEEVRPETLSIAFTIPVLILSYLSVKDDDILFSFLAIIYSIITFKFHESGLILLISAITPAFIFLIRHIKPLAKTIINNFRLFLIVILPYMIIGIISFNKLLDFFQGGLTFWMVRYIQTSFSNIHWTWWFLNDAVTVNGARISWPGINAVYYYAYDGMSLFVVTTIFWLIFLKLKRYKLKDKLFLPLLPILIFFFLHIFYAEILPRMGTILLFNRSWPYIMLALTTLSVIFIVKIFDGEISRGTKLFIYFSMAICIITGIVGSVLGSMDMGAMVLPQEKSVISALQDLPQGSIVLSTQRNHNLVKIYGQKRFFQVESRQYDKDNFSSQVIDEVYDMQEGTQMELVNNILITQDIQDRLYIFDNLMTENQKKYTFTEIGEKLQILKQHSPGDYKIINDKVNDLKNISDENVYFIYSFAKLDHGLLAKRSWWQESSDKKNYDFFKKYKKNIIFKDDNCVLIKIR